MIRAICSGPTHRGEFASKRFLVRSSRPPRASQGQGFTAFSQLERLAVGADFGTRPAGWWRKWNGTRGDLFPRGGFLVTNLKWSTKRVVRFSNRRGTAEQWIKEGKNAVKWTKPSCRRFKDGGIDCVGGKPSQWPLRGLESIVGMGAETQVRATWERSVYTGGVPVHLRRIQP